MKKGTLLFAFLLTFTTILHTNIKAETHVVKSYSLGVSGLSDKDIADYITDNYGENLFTYTQAAGSSNITVDTKEGHRYLLYVVDGIIIDSVEVPIG